MINITIWSDFACPYCYIGETRLKQAIEQLNLNDQVEINYRAFELDPYAPKEVTTTTPERFAKKYRMTIEEATQQIEQISALGREIGIDFRYISTNYSNTRDAHRVMKLAEARYNRATVENLNEALFKAYFVENLILSDHNVLGSIAEDAGMNPDKVREMLSTDEFTDEVRLDEREAAMRGIRGVPYMIFNGSFAVPGAMSIDNFKAVLEREMKKVSDNMRENTDTHACGPDGCIL